jgi:Skp family chaperone for outer membrane proteins
MVAAMSAALTTAAEVKIGTVNMVDLVRLHPNHESNRTLVKTTDAEYKAKLDAKQDELKEIAEEGKKAQSDLQNPMLSTQARATAQKKLEGIQQRFLNGQQDMRQMATRFQNDLGELETRLLKMETDDIRAKISAYAKAHGYDFIADGTILAFAKESYDVTDDILKSMGVDPAKRKEKKEKEKKSDAGK